MHLVTGRLPRINLDMAVAWDKDRSMKSLHILARKFVELMRESDNGTINLREVSILVGIIVRML